MPVEILGMITSADSSETRGNGRYTELDPAFIDAHARAHDEGGFDRVLIGYGSTGPDGWSIAGRILHRTEHVRVLIAHRPGFVEPTLAARRAATLDHLTGGGRVGIHIITGGNEQEQRRDGDYLDHDTRYARSAEFIEVFKKTLASPEPFDYAGRFYRYEKAFSAVKPATGAGIPVFFGGSSPAALAVGSRWSDVYAVWGEPLDSLRSFFDRIRAAAPDRAQGPAFSVSLRPILGDTEAEAWARADRIAATTEERLDAVPAPQRAGLGLSSSVGRERLLEHADEKDVHDERLWTKVAGITRSGGNTTALVGTPQQVADALLRYYDIGATRILIRGFDPLEDAVEYGEKLLPLIRAGVAERDARLAEAG
jgi:alkanesulfonate monooxygenase